MSEATNDSAAVITEAESRIGEAAEAGKAITAAEAGVEEAKELTGDDADEKREAAAKTLTEARQGGQVHMQAMAKTLGGLVKVAQAGPSSAPDWREGIDKDLIPVVEKFTSPAEVVKSYAELQKKLGNAIVPPAEGATPEEIEAFQIQRGRPKTPEDYKLEAPDLSDVGDGIKYNEDLEKFARSLFHRAGLNQSEAVMLFNGYNEFQLAAAEQMAEDDGAAMEKAKTELEAEWGSDYDANMDFANRSLELFFGKEARKLVLADGILVGSHPIFARGLAEIGRRIGEARLPIGEADDESRQTLEERLTELQARGDYWTNPKIQTEVRAINDQLHGTAPADRPAEGA